MHTALIIDDDEKILDLVEERLSSMSHNCHRAQSQSEAEEMLEKHSYDYVLLDLEIPSKFQGRADMIYGQNLLRKLMESPEHAQTPVIVITAHGLTSHHLCADMMGIGASAFVGKPFGRENPLEEKIREVLKKKGRAKNGGTHERSAKLEPFRGGDLVFYDDRVELCGVVVCGAKGSSTARHILELLSKKTARNTYVKMAISQLKAAGIGDVRDGRIAEAVADFRRTCRDRLREGLGLACELQDVIANKKQGYHFPEWIIVKSGIDDSEKTAEERGVRLTEDQKRIIQQLRKHGARTPRQLSDNLSLRAEVITQQTEKLLKAGIVKDSGAGRARAFELVSAEVE